MSPIAERVIHRLDAARQKWWLCSLLSTVVLACCGSLALFLTFSLADAFTGLSQEWLAGLFTAWLMASAALLFVVGRRLARGQRSLEAAARRVEFAFPEMSSHLINVVQLSEPLAVGRRRHGDGAFYDAAVREAASRIERASFDKAPCGESRWRRFLYCMQTPRDLVESVAAMAALLAVAWACQTHVPNLASAASRLLTPWKFVPSVGSVAIVRVSPGNADVLLGESLEVTAEIRNPEAKPYQGRLFLASEGEPESAVPLTADERCECYKATIPSVAKPFGYRLEIGDSQTPMFRVNVRSKPTIESAEITFHYPGYLERPPETFSRKDLDLEAPQYTTAELRLRCTSPIAKGYLEAGNERFPGRVEQEGRLLAASLPLLKNGGYLVRMYNDVGQTDSNPRLNRVTVQLDRPPTVDMIKPAGTTSLAPGEEAALVIRATDDHGIGRIRLVMKVQSSAADGNDEANDEASEADAATVVEEWNDFGGGSTHVVRTYRIVFKPELVKPGQTVLLRATAWDKRLLKEWGLSLGPQEASSGWLALRVIGEDVAAATVLQQLETLRAALMKLLEKQVAARVDAGAMMKKEASAERHDALAAVRGMQIALRVAAVDLAKSIVSSDRREQTLAKRVLNELTVGEMLQAVILCDQMMKVAEDRALSKLGTELIGVQERVIDALRRLLEMVRRAQAALPAENKRSPGADLPDDVKKKLEEIRNKLDVFLAQQKKVLEASEDLAKKPVEDYTEEDAEVLKRLAAAEDELSKFMNEIHSDLSKLPEQDFANPSVAQELIEIQTELKMAEDALLKKSVDIAVPLEQLGYEMAEELKTNFEKWLPDSPDREKWSQEESLTDESKEAPMAELPAELEDMVGELMEQEEDLFDEMEDASSSAADSLDRGAAWDAMDGPISNMSAKGVTGNRLPNTSEIGGRAGEGRQGKSSGEFVGDEAVGKGGRRTPSRLTPDPYVKGHIKDHGKEAAGGATGGGKESGQGGGGLEGPVPPKPDPSDALRLAGRQAELRNKAEGIALKMRVSNFHRTDLQKMIELMARIEQDLRSGRYQNALRQRPVMVEGLRNVKQYLQGEFEVRKDATPSLPTDIQKKILGSMEEASPAGWEDLNREYFERLSENATEHEKPPKGTGI